MRESETPDVHASSEHHGFEVRFK